MPEDWLQRLGAFFDPSLIITKVRDSDGDVPIWAGKTARDGQPTAYICRNFSGSAPLVNWEEIEQVLR